MEKMMVKDPLNLLALIIKVAQRHRQDSPKYLGLWAGLATGNSLDVGPIMLENAPRRATHIPDLAILTMLDPFSESADT